MSWSPRRPGGFITSWPSQSGVELNQYNLARRPTDWRADYTRDGWMWKLFGLLPAIFLPATDVPYWKDTMHREVHPLLLYRRSQPPVRFDLRRSPSPTDRLFTILSRSYDDDDLTQLAFDPPASSMRLFHPRLPWYVDIKKTHPHGITVFDVLEALKDQLQVQIKAKHFWNTALRNRERAVISRSFQARCQNHLELWGFGALRVDFLGEDCVFEGLVKRGKGMCEIKTRTVY